MRRLVLCFQLGCPPLGDTDLAAEESIEPIVPAFHAILRRPVFAGLPSHLVSISFRCKNHPYTASPSARDVASANIKTIMVPLLAPWLARRVVSLRLPDGSYVRDAPPVIGSAVLPTNGRPSVGDGAELGHAE